MSLNSTCFTRGCHLTYTAGHLQLDQAIELNRVFHGEFPGDGLNEAVDDQRVGLGLIKSAAHQVEELVVTDLRDGCLVADLGLVLLNPNGWVGIGASIFVEQERVTTHMGLGVVRTPVGCGSGRDTRLDQSPWRPTSRGFVKWYVGPGV